MSNSNQYSPGGFERAVRMVFDHEHDYPSQWVAIRSIAEKIGVFRGERLRSTATPFPVPAEATADQVRAAPGSDGAT